jgi:hypothetical protein
MIACCQHAQVMYVASVVGGRCPLLAVTAVGESVHLLNGRQLANLHIALSFCMLVPVSVSVRS